MTRLPGWGLLLAIGVPLLILVGWNRLGAQASRINIDRYEAWSHGYPALPLRPLQEFFATQRRAPGPGEVALPAVPASIGVKAWALQAGGVLRIDLDARDEGHPLVLTYVPVVRDNGRVMYDCVSNTVPLHVNRFCRAEVIGSAADIPARIAANAQALLEVPPAVSAAGVEVAAGAGGSVVAVPAAGTTLESCGYPCVRLQTCVTPRPLACGRLVREGNSSTFEIGPTADEFRGSSFATLADADQACERSRGEGARVLRASSISGRSSLAAGSEYWVHDEMKPANNCWGGAR